MPSDVTVECTIEEGQPISPAFRAHHVENLIADWALKPHATGSVVACAKLYLSLSSDADPAFPLGQILNAFDGERIMWAREAFIALTIGRWTGAHRDAIIERYPDLWAEWKAMTTAAQEARREIERRYER